MGPSPWLGSDTLRLARRPPKLFAFSPEIVPPPSDWPAHAFVTGPWFLDSPEGWAPPARLVEFFEAGEPPVYVGFGSMTAPRPEEVTRAVIEAVRKAGRRAVLSAGWGGLTASAEGDRAQSVRAHGVSAHGVSAHGVSAQGASAHGVSAQGASAQGASEHGVRAEGVRANDILFVGDVPHGWLFPRVAGVVHHGGAGTTASAFRAGVPQMAIPFLADQPFWGHRIAQLGAGPAPLPIARLDADSLLRGLQAMDTPAVRRAAASLGHRIRAERGAEKAVSIIERLALSSRLSSSMANGRPRGGPSF
jgi:UDP:flavonoid glycosyltransferase YjiC (YdhE family)